MVQISSMINADEASEPRSEHQSTDAGLAKMLKEETVLGYEDDVAADNRKMLCEMNLEGLNQERMNSLTAKADEISSADANSIDPSESPESSVTCHAAINTPSSTTNHHIEKRHICVICGKAFPYLSILESHKRCHTGEKPFSCHFCDKKFAQKATLQVHERTHTGERPYKCKYCEKTFAQYGTKTVHEKSAHLGIRNYKCPKCSKLLSSPSALYTHKKTHGEKTFTCEFCPKTFTLKNYLKLHVKQVHEQNERKHICQYCNKTFAYAGSLQVHVRTHTGERPYTCRYCPKAFASQGNLQSHERTHTGERPYSCSHCGRSFIQKSQLTAHEATHQYQPGVSAPELAKETSPDPLCKKQNDYICKYCGKRYAYASSLYVHTRLHTGERPFRCSYCDKSFTNQGNMQVHQRVHTGEKPYKCNACDKSYAQKVGLKIHLEQCQQYLSNEGVISADEDLEKPNAIECLIPNILRIQDGAISLTPFQYSPQIVATERHDSANSSPVSIKPPTSSPFQTTQSPQTKLFAPPQQMPVSTPSSLLVERNTNATISPPKATAIAQVHVPTQNIISPSAFHGIVSDPYKGSASPSFSHPQLVTLKRLLDGTTACSQFVPAQFLLPNQQLQLLLQSSQPSEQWCTNASAMNHQQQYHQNHQPMSHFMSNIPNGLSSYVSLLPQLTATFPGVVMQSGFVPPTIKNESSPMIV